MEQIRGYCHRICNECPIFQATQQDNDQKRADIAATLSEVYDRPFRIGDINCDGCGTKNSRLYMLAHSCSIRAKGIQEADKVISPISPHTDLSKDLTSFIITGTVTVSEIFDVVMSFKDEPPAKNILWDFSKAEVGNLFTPDAFQKIASRAKSNLGLRPGSRTAFIATSDIVFGLIRMYTTYLELQEIAHEVEVFRTIEEAYQWLDSE